MTNDDLAAFIEWYFDAANSRRFWSGLIRVVAIIGGVLAAVALSTADVEVIKFAGWAVIATGGALSVDWAFAVTRKYTNWMAFAYELGVDRANFNIAFMKLYVDVADDEVNEATFMAARELAQATVADFRAKRSEETKQWANQLQSVMESLRKSNKELANQLQSESNKALDKHRRSLEKVGLTIRIKADAERPDGLVCRVLDDSAANLVAEFAGLSAREEVARFFPMGDYVITLEHESVKLASMTLSLNRETTTSI